MKISVNSIYDKRRFKSELSIRTSGCSTGKDRQSAGEHQEQPVSWTLSFLYKKDVDVGENVRQEGLTMAGLTAEDRLHICYGYGLFTGGMGLDFGARKLGAMAIPMSAGNTKRQLMCMEDFGATAFARTPSYALYLAEAANEAGIVDKLWLKVGINGAEPWTEEMRLKIEELLNVNWF